MHSLGVYFIFNIFLFVMGGFIFIKTTPDLMKKREYTIFKIFIGAFGFYIIANSFWTMQEYEVIKAPEWLFKIICVCSLSGVMFTTFCFYKFLMIYYGYNDKKNNLYEVFGALPFLIIVILIITSIWHNFIFSISEGKNIVSEKGYILLPIVAFIYFGIILTCSLVKLIKSKSPQVRKNLFTMFLTTIILIIWVIIDDLIQGLTILPMAVFFVIMVLFTTFQQASINTDALTQMNNRRKAMEFLSSQIASVSMETPMYLYLCDINSFKGINDNYGHIEGDNALVILSSAIKEVANSYLAFAARYGGDEFIIAIKPKEENYKPKEIIDKIDDIVKTKCILYKKPYDISVSYGLVICQDKTITIENYIREADESLYENKNNSSLDK